MNLHSLKLKIIAIFILIIIAVSLGLAHPAKAILPVEDIPARVWDGVQYVLQKTGTIFFQNTLRETLNEFAYDYGTYLGSGGQGQNPLYVIESWGNFWEKTGDKASGDFIESFANSVISDIATVDIINENKERCEKKRKDCIKNSNGNNSSELACRNSFQDCLMTSGVGDKSLVKEKCKTTYDSCNQDCSDKWFNSNKDSESSRSKERCEQNCEVIYNGCFNDYAYKNNADRKKPMLGLGSPLANINICNPSLNLSLKLGLGLTQYGDQRYQPDCTFTKMKDNWKNFVDKYADMSKGNYLKRLNSQFVDPAHSDLGISLRLYSGMIEYRGKKINEEVLKITATEGWKEPMNWAAELFRPPGDSEQRKHLVEEALFDNIGTVTGDILVDAASIFLNRLAITGWNNLMGNLTDNKDYKSLGFYDTVAIGKSNIENRISKILEPKFTKGNVFNLLVEMANCSNESSPGPTDCVFTSEFANAVTNEKTLIQAVKDRNLPGNWPFGFNKRGEDKIEYNQGYPYRSILILKKYRIIPVGWDLAAQKIEQMYKDGINFNRPDGITLMDLINCFDPNDEFHGYGDDKGSKEYWCRGLVDPYWVLKLPEQYCGARGYGPELDQEPTTNKTRVRFCSKDNGKTKALIDKKYSKCDIDADCCSIDERVAKDRLDPFDSKYKYKLANTCLAKCSYEEYELTVMRKKYCADEQSCIKEDDDGNCLFFGYCTRESRGWKFSKNNTDVDCKPMFNSCQTFRNKKGKSVSYLQNTLDYGCTTNSIGCLSYSSAGNYDKDTDKLAWNMSGQVFNFNNKVNNCRNRSEGCHEFIALQEGKQVNLIADSSFNNSTRWENKSGSSVKVVNLETYPDLKNILLYADSSLQVRGQNGIVFSPNNNWVLPSGFKFELDRYYTLSAKIYVANGGVEVSIGNTSDNNSWQSVYSSNLGSWEEYILTINNDFTINANSFFIKGISDNAEFYIDDIKFEIGKFSGYSAYRATDSLIYQKILPDYLEDVCYEDMTNNYSLKENAPEKCFEFARKCNANEVGCKLFTETRSKDKTAAKVKPKDYCPKECVDYDTFIQQENYFYSSQPSYFIPRTAKSCSARAEGCSLMVNLDKLKEGGESDEYYSRLRQCIKPGKNICGEFYTWEGSDETGYQLVVFNLKENLDSNISQPEVTINNDNTSDYNDGDLCNEDIYGLPSNHPLANPDCRQFYGRDGNLSYHLYSKTISCSDECYPYRKVENNIDVSINSSIDCKVATNFNRQANSGDDWTGANGYWDDVNQYCIVCSNNGIWSKEHNACIYNGIPSKSISCSKNQVGCSEYTGNFGNNVRLLINDDFENGLNHWNGDVRISSDSVVRGGHSLMTNKTSFFMKSIFVKPDMNYEVSFIAKRNLEGAYIKSIKFVTVNGENVTSDVVNTFTKEQQITSDWQQYKFIINPINEDKITHLEFDIGGNSQQSNSVRIDNIKLKEFNDRYYFIKNSWSTPDSCNQDYQGRPYPLYMLGCKQYVDSQNKRYNLRSFSQLCQLSGVGCQSMIDTHNSSYYGAEIFNDYNDNDNCFDDYGNREEGCIEVKADEFTYIVYDKKKSCSSSNKGCQRLGQKSLYGSSYTDIYLLNNPDDYLNILCSDKQVGCEAWRTINGSEVYFKDPANNVCEYREIQGQGTMNWLKKHMSYCAKPCSTHSDCSRGESCINFSKDSADKFCWNYGNINSNRICTRKSDCMDNKLCKLYSMKDIPCLNDILTPKTIGLGVVDDRIQPLGMLLGHEAGLCDKKLSGCTEYIDPESRINTNISIPSSEQDIKLIANVMYIAKTGMQNDAYISCKNEYGLQAPIYYLDNLNVLRLSGETNNTALKIVNDGNEHGYSEEFYVSGPDSSSVDCKITGELAYLRKAVVAYKLKDTINNEKPTKINFDNGEILFNERSYNGMHVKGLLYNSILSQNSKVNALTSLVTGKLPKFPPTVPPGDNANTLLKVEPDRQCSEWLGCKSYSVNPLDNNDTICYERGLCNQMNEAGECINFINTEPINQMYNSNFFSPVNLSDIADMTGYVKVGYSDNNFNSDYYRLADMTQIGNTKVKFDGTFENKYYSEFYRGNNLWEATFRAPVINDARIIEKELGYGEYKRIPDGQAIAKSKDYVAIDVQNVGEREYVVSAYVFMRYGQKVDLSVGNIDRNSSECPFVYNNHQVDCVGNSYIVDTSNKVGEWVRLTGKFNIDAGYINEENAIRIGLYTDGLIYFDDVRMEPALNIKYNQYIHSNCRIYSERDSLSCDYFNNKGLRKKGWAGYCIEFDPRDSNTCLMWYPIDKVEAEEFEEGVALDFAKDIYYCIDSEDYCSNENPVQPEMYCKKFIKVNNEKYWYNRMNEGSGYKIPYKLLLNNSTTRDSFSVDFGVTNKYKIGGKKENFQITQNISNNALYGAYSTENELGDERLVSGIDNNGEYILPFLPYYGYSRAERGSKDDEYYCRATLDERGKDKPIEVSESGGGENQQLLGVYDHCFVGVTTQWADCEESGLNTCCGQWDYSTRNCSNDSNYWTNCTRTGYNFYCKTNKCVESDDTDSCRDRVNLPPDGGYKILPDEPDVRCEVFINEEKNELYGKATDTVSGLLGGDDDGAGCFFDCFNHINKYNIADFVSGNTNVKDAVNRLFIDTDSRSCWEWVSDNNRYEECDNDIDLTAPPRECPETGRPKPDDNNPSLDFCSVYPKVLNVKSNHNLLVSEGDSKYYHVTGKAWIPIYFNSIVSEEQLPLKKYIVDMGFVINDSNVTLPRNVNMYDRRPPANSDDINNSHVVNYFFDYKEISRDSGNNSRCNDEYCEIRPSVYIEDNWGLHNNPNSIDKLMDYPIRVYK